jgi:hypothetical protein
MSRNNEPYCFRERFWRRQLRPETTLEGANQAFIETIGKAWEEKCRIFSSTDREDIITDTLILWIQNEQRRLDDDWFAFSQVNSLH